MHDVCRILLVDDHKLLMEGIRSLLAPHSHLRVAGMAPDGKEAVGLAATLSPDLVIMDISMPGMNGVEASRAILQIRPETRILIYTGHEDQRHLLELIQLGIMGHVCKSDPPSVLLQAIDAVRQGRHKTTPPRHRPARTGLGPQTAVPVHPVCPEDGYGTRTAAIMAQDGRPSPSRTGRGCHRRPQGSQRRTDMR